MNKYDYNLISILDQVEKNSLLFLVVIARISLIILKKKKHKRDIIFPSLLKILL